MDPPDLVAASMRRLAADAGRDETVLAAVSGGADSTALLVALAEYAQASGMRLTMCHFNHRLRPAPEHESDLAHLRDLAGRYHLPLVIGEAAAGEIVAAARERRCGVEAAARDARYRFFRAAARVTGARWICTGHTRDDQVETVLLALERGVGALGLGGIPELRPLAPGLVVVRPLLDVDRQDLEGFLTEIGIPWTEDPTNRSEAHARNRIRNRVLPALERAVPGIRDAVLEIREHAASERAAAAREAARIGWERSGERATIDCREFFAAPTAARLLSLYEESRRRGMNRPSSRIPGRFFAALLGESLPRSGTIISGRGQVIRREADLLVWEPDVVRHTDYGYLRSVVPGLPLSLPTGHVITVHAGEKGVTEPGTIVIELNGAQEPLVVRSYRAGDRVQTAGGSRTVASVLSDQKVPVAQRRLTPVIADRLGVLAVLSGLTGGQNVATSGDFRRAGEGPSVFSVTYSE